MKDDPDRTEKFKRETRMAQVQKLRINWDAMGEMANIERSLAAGTIQDLMDEVEAWQNAMRNAERDIAQLRAERDEARRDLCRFYCANDTEWGSGPFPMEQSTPSMFATLKGWDCFKEKA